MKPNAVIAGLVILAVPGAVLAQNPQGAVSELVVSGEPEVAVPKIGPGAPLISLEEFETVAGEARRAETLSRQNARYCSSATLSDNLETATTIRELLASSYRAEEETARRVQVMADRASLATQAATQARRSATRKEVTPYQVRIAELQRQLAVYNFINAQNAAEAAKNRTYRAQRLIREHAQAYPDPYAAAGQILGIVRSQLYLSDESFIPGGAGIGALPAEYQDLKLENIQVVERRGDRDTTLQVSGTIRNGRTRAAPTPSLFISALDDQGFPLRTETADAGGSIKPGDVLGFNYEFKKPLRAKTVAVTFASRAKGGMTLPIGFPLITQAQEATEAGEIGRTLDCSDRTRDPVIGGRGGR